MVTHHSTPATNGSDGTLTYYSCPDCGGFYSDESSTEQISEWDVPLIAHYPEVIEAHPASCTSGGIANTYYKCVTCNGAFEDAACTIRIWDEQSMILPSTGHSDTNSDLICDVCNQTITPLEFRKVTDASDITAGGTYILVNESGKIMGKPVYDKDKGISPSSVLPSVSVSAENSRYNYYMCKASGAMIFNLKHIYDFQSWGSDISMVYGMHFDGFSLACYNGEFYPENEQWSKYGMRFVLKEDGSVNIDSHYDVVWNGESTDNIFFRSYSDSKSSDTVFAMKPDMTGTEEMFIFTECGKYSVADALLQT